MRVLLFITMLMPVVALGQGFALNMNAGGPNGQGGGQDHKLSASVNGSISFPNLVSVSATTHTTNQAIFRDFEDINNGKILENYSTVTINSNQPWVLYANIDHSLSGNDDVITYSIREAGKSVFRDLSFSPEPILRSSNANIVNTLNFDVKLKTDYRRFKPGNHNVNIIFTVSPQ